MVFFLRIGIAAVCFVIGWLYWNMRIVVTPEYVEQIGFQRKRIYYESVRNFYSNRRLPWIKGESTSITLGADYEDREELLALVERYVKRSKRGPKKKGAEQSDEEIDEVPLPSENPALALEQEADKRRSRFSMKVKEADAWSKTREIGFLRYLLHTGILQWGPFLLVPAVARLVLNPPNNWLVMIVVVVVLSFLGGVLASLLMWYSMEWKYRRYLGDQPQRDRVLNERL
jgi:hypothetical protein